MFSNIDSVYKFFRVRINIAKKNIQQYGIVYHMDCLTSSLCRRLRILPIFSAVHMADYRYVKRRYKVIASKKHIFKASPRKPNTIWVIWWQGRNVEKPKVVEACINSIKQNKGNYNLVIIDKDNYSDYIDIHKTIINKFNEGRIGIAAFSDYIRFSLLEKYGGWYMDATIFTTKTIVEPKNSFYSIKYDGYKDHISKAKWSAYLWYLPEKHPLSTFVREVFEDYWSNHNEIINYFLIDCVVRTFYEHSETFHNQIDSLNYDNPSLYFFQETKSRERFEEKTWNSISANNQFFKCNRKNTCYDPMCYFGKILGTE